MTLSEARKSIIYARSEEGFKSAAEKMLEEGDALVISELFIDLQSRLTAWILDKVVPADEKEALVDKCEAFLKAKGEAALLREAKKEVASIATASSTYLCKQHDMGRMGFIWGHDLATGFYWSLRRGARFVTTNPAKVNVFRKDYPAEWAALLADLRKDYPDLTPEETVTNMYVRVVAEVCKELQPIYELSGGKYGFACIQPNPTTLMDADAMEADIRYFEKEFRRIFKTDDPNVVYKIPATPAARKTVAALRREDCYRLCMTLDFSVFQHDTFGDIIGQGNHGDFLVLMGGIVDDFVKKELIADGMDEAEATDVSHYAATAILNRSYANNKRKGIKPIIMAGSARGAWSTEAVICEDAEQPMCITSMANMIAVYDSAPRANVDVISQPLDEAKLAILNKSSIFHKAFDFDGLSDETLMDYPPLQFVQASFVNAYYETLESVK